MLDLAIVIVNFNTQALLRDCLRSVFASEGDFTYRVCIVDNASSDGSAEMVRAEFPQVDLIANSENVGYPRANNQGLRHFGFNDVGSQPHSRSEHDSIRLPRYILLLNPDTVLPPTALREMMSFMDARPDCGIAGPKLVRQDGSLDLACRRSFPTPEISFWRMVGMSRLFPRHPRFGRYNLTHLDPDVLTEVDSVVGAFMMVRREAILQVGLLDEAFFMYGEDLDWAYRVKQQGWRVWYNPAVTVLHYKAASSKHSERAQHEFYRAMTIFYRKHYAATTPWPLHWFILGGIAMRGSLVLLGRRLRQWKLM
ncbi:MAG TPA: glycosyltransferase [Anaerolineae bacterium]|nr:glycosyltransferase [Anaerolineae bacterium]